MNTNKTFKTFVVLIAFIMTNVCVASMKCKGPVSNVIVTVNKIDNRDASSFAYSLTNKANLSIANLKIGDGSKMELRPFPGQDVEVTESPKGWSGRFGNKHESIYGDIFWYTNKKENFVQPGNTLSGFKINVTGKYGKADGSIGNDGLPLNPVDFANLPFAVDFYRGGCVWGRIQPKQ